jgi:hypothetical protein
MAASTPYGQLIGPCKIYVAAASTAEPDVSLTPGAAWTELGATTGEQVVGKEGDMLLFYDNDHQGPVKGAIPQEDIMATFILANLTHAHYSRIINNVGKITTAAGPPAVSRVPLKSGYIPTEYALLIKGLADSPFGNYPAQTYLPRGAFEKAHELTRGKENRAELACTFRVFEDDTQTEDNKMGWTTAQTS